MNYICHKSIWTQGSDGRVLPLSRFAHNGHLRRGGQLDGLQGHRHHWHQADYLQTQFKVLVSKSYLIFFSFYIFLQIFYICSVYFNRYFLYFLYSINFLFLYFRILLPSQPKIWELCRPSGSFEVFSNFAKVLLIFRPLGFQLQYIFWNCMSSIFLKNNFFDHILLLIRGVVVQTFI